MEAAMGSMWRRMGRQALTAGVIALLAVACGGEGTTEGLEGIPSSLSGTWELAMISTNAAGPQQASRDRYDATLTIDGTRNTFQITEWLGGRETTSSGMVVVDGDELKLIHTADYQTVARVDEALWSVKDDRLAMAVGEKDWTVYYYDRP
jgi:hypothetical protein